MKLDMDRLIKGLWPINFITCLCIVHNLYNHTWQINQENKVSVPSHALCNFYWKKLSDNH